MDLEPRAAQVDMQKCPRPSGVDEMRDDAKVVEQRTLESDSGGEEEDDPSSRTDCERGLPLCGERRGNEGTAAGE